ETTDRVPRHPVAHRSQRPRHRDRAHTTRSRRPHHGSLRARPGSLVRRRRSRLPHLFPAKFIQISAKSAPVLWIGELLGMMTPEMKSSLLMCLIAAALVTGCQSASHPTIAPVPPPPNTALARQENDRAYELIKQGKDKEAESILHRAIDADVTFGPAHNNL